MMMAQSKLGMRDCGQSWPAPLSPRR